MVVASSCLRTTVDDAVAVGAVFGSILGVVAGVWAIDTRQPDSYSFYGGSNEPPDGGRRSPAS